MSDTSTEIFDFPHPQDAARPDRTWIAKNCQKDTLRSPVVSTASIIWFTRSVVTDRSPLGSTEAVQAARSSKSSLSCRLRSACWNVILKCTSSPSGTLSFSKTCAQGHVAFGGVGPGPTGRGSTQCPGLGGTSRCLTKPHGHTQFQWLPRGPCEQGRGGGVAAKGVVQAHFPDPPGVAPVTGAPDGLTRGGGGVGWGGGGFGVAQHIYLKMIATTR